MAGPLAGPLDGIRVLDLTSVIMGPYATQILGDLGADVISVEERHGDTNRFMGPGPHRELSGVSLNLLRNKRNVCLDLKVEADRDLFLQIAATSDIVVTNLRPGPLRRLRLTYDDVRAVRSDVIFCEAHGFREDSPQANDPAYDDVIQAASGLADAIDRVTGEPRVVPSIIADKVCGLTIVYSVLAAVVHRQRTGEGQHIEVPMLDTMRAFTLVEHAAGATPVPAMGPAGYGRVLSPSRGPQPTADGWISVLPYTNRHWHLVLGEVGRGALMDDPRMATGRDRVNNADFAYGALAEVLRMHTTEYWMGLCEANDVPATRIGRLDDIVADLPVVEHPVVGRYHEIPIPVRFSATPGSIRRPAPFIGEHTNEIRAEMAPSIFRPM